MKRSLIQQHERGSRDSRAVVAALGAGCASPDVLRPGGQRASESLIGGEIWKDSRLLPLQSSTSGVASEIAVPRVLGRLFLRIIERIVIEVIPET
ncbi:MAG: hypothetical protein ACRD7E_32840 [Bryobacteraceae bacterium]